MEMSGRIPRKPSVIISGVPGRNPQGRALSITGRGGCALVGNITKEQSPLCSPAPITLNSLQAQAEDLVGHSSCGSQDSWWAVVHPEP